MATALPLETSGSSMEDAVQPYPPDTGGNLERVGATAGLLAPVSTAAAVSLHFNYVCVERLLPCATLLFIGGYYARVNNLGVFVDINTFSFGLILPKEGIRMISVDPVALQAFCAIATFVLTVYVARRDTKQMKSEEARRKETEMLAQPSSIAAWLERSSSGESCLVIRNESDLPVYEVVVTVVVTYGAGCCKGEDLGSSYQYRKKFDLVPSGFYSSDIDMRGFGGMHRHPLVEIAFACANGTFWVRRGNGVLVPLDSSPFNYYELGLPIEFDSVTPYQKS